MGKLTGRYSEDNRNIIEVTDRPVGKFRIVYYDPDNLRDRKPRGKLQKDIEENIATGKWVKIGEAE